ncbi:MAG: class I SAM-dependent methyltransferase [Burkholderiales bacterium]|nr:class I SAM-dependent methyltransferase [Burkholderiales bacterium]
MNTVNDVASPVDLRLPQDAADWESTAMVKRPWRTEFFQSFVDLIGLDGSECNILELGSGPGFLAQHILEQLPNVKMTLLDFSPAMHELARARLEKVIHRVTILERSFKDSDWVRDMETFSFVVTNQAVHELRHKRHATALHAQVRSVLAPSGKYLVCDHYAGEGGMSNTSLYMTVEEQRTALNLAGYTSVVEVKRMGGLVLCSATSWDDRAKLIA